MSLSTIRDEVVGCERCPRLRQYCERVAREKRAAHRAETYWGRPVPGFGDPQARLLVIGLAPGAHGANRTGRVFTGDGRGGSGNFLMHAMHRHGFANLPTADSADDGLRLQDAYIGMAVRCAPPGNKPTREELANCRPYLLAEVDALRALRVVVALGRIAFDAWWRVMDARGVTIRPRPVFAHGRRYRPAGAPVVIASYHPSRQNTHTGRLTAPMLDRVFREARQTLGDDSRGTSRTRRDGV